MNIYCTRPLCPKPRNFFNDLEENQIFYGGEQKYCLKCGMQLILEGRYLPLKPLGKGGFGMTFLSGYCLNPQKSCIIKQLLPPAKLNFEQLELIKRYFHKEAESLQKLSKHPQIPELFAFFSSPAPASMLFPQQSFFYLVQEFIDGENLQQELEMKGKFSEEEVLQFLQEMLPILDFIHRNGCIHRDIKPANIICDRHQHQLYLLDFGTVKQATAGIPTENSLVFATPSFAPQEQMEGKQVFPSSDLYSLAVTCLCLLTGKKVSDLYDISTNKWNWINYTEAGSLAPVLERMLMPEPHQRFQQAKDVIKALVDQKTKLSLEDPPDIEKFGSKFFPQIYVLDLFLNIIFTGFEGGLFLIAIFSLLGTSWISSGFWLLIWLGLILIQYRQVIPKSQLFIIALITLTIVLLFPELQSFIKTSSNFKGIAIFLLAILSGLLTFSLIALYRLIYQIFDQFL